MLWAPKPTESPIGAGGGVPGLLSGMAPAGSAEATLKA